ncbi:hypothetical protein Tco_1361116 [Tanacetum coccineum]
MTLRRSCLRWKPTGKIFKTVGLRWVPTGKIFTSSTTKVDSEPPNGSNEDITTIMKYENSCYVSAGLDDGVAASFQRSRIHKPHAHTQAFKVNRSTSRSLILIFPTIKEPHNQIKNRQLGKIVRLIIIYVKQECNKYEHVGQEHKMIKEVKSR